MEDWVTIYPAHNYFMVIMTEWRLEDWVTIIQHTRVIWSPVNIDHIKIYVCVVEQR